MKKANVKNEKDKTTMGCNWRIVILSICMTISLNKVWSTQKQSSGKKNKSLIIRLRRSKRTGRSSIKIKKECRRRGWNFKINYNEWILLNNESKGGNKIGRWDWNYTFQYKWTGLK